MPSLRSLLPTLLPTHLWLAGALLAAPALGAPAHRAAPARSPRPLDRAARIDFTFTGGGHTGERVQIRDLYPEETPPFARFDRSGIIYGLMEPLFELRGGKLGPKQWAAHFIVDNSSGTTAGMRVTSGEPAVIYNGDNTHAQQSWFAKIILPPLRQGTLAVTIVPGAPAGRLRGTFAGTLVDDAGQEVTVTDGSFDLPRIADLP